MVLASNSRTEIRSRAHAWWPVVSFQFRAHRRYLIDRYWVKMVKKTLFIWCRVSNLVRLFFDSWLGHSNYVQIWALSNKKWIFITFLPHIFNQSFKSAANYLGLWYSYSIFFYSFCQGIDCLMILCLHLLRYAGQFF